MLEVFFKDRVLLLGSDPCQQDFFPFKLESSKDLALLLDVFSATEVKGACWSVSDVNAAIDRLKLFSNYVQAAGGLITYDNRFLGILRLGVWDLPKGKRDAGESITTTAIREIREETGLIVEKPLYICRTFHTYPDFSDPSRLCLKETFWYKFSVGEQQELKLQAEEHIEMAEWFDVNDPGPFLRNTYSSLHKVIAHL